MAVSVRLPTVLRPQAGGASSVDAAGGTVGEVLGDIVNRFPTMTDHLLDDEGGARRFVNIYVNDEDIRFLDQLDTGVTDGDEVSILPAVAGG